MKMLSPKAAHAGLLRLVEISSATTRDCPPAMLVANQGIESRMDIRAAELELSHWPVGVGPN
jgi:hypothetical protein